MATNMAETLTPSFLHTAITSAASGVPAVSGLMASPSSSASKEGASTGDQLAAKLATGITSRQTHRQPVSGGDALLYKVPTLSREATKYPYSTGRGLCIYRWWWFSWKQHYSTAYYDRRPGKHSTHFYLFISVMANESGLSVGQRPASFLSTCKSRLVYGPVFLFRITAGVLVMVKGRPLSCPLGYTSKLPMPGNKQGP